MLPLPLNIPEVPTAFQWLLVVTKGTFISDILLFSSPLAQLWQVTPTQNSGLQEEWRMVSFYTFPLPFSLFFFSCLCQSRKERAGKGAVLFTHSTSVVVLTEIQLSLWSLWVKSYPLPCWGRTPKTGPCEHISESAGLLPERSLMQPPLPLSVSPYLWHFAPAAQKTQASSLLWISSNPWESHRLLLF